MLACLHALVTCVTHGFDCVLCLTPMGVWNITGTVRCRPLPEFLREAPLGWDPPILAFSGDLQLAPQPLDHPPTSIQDTPQPQHPPSPHEPQPVAACGHGRGRLA